MVENKLNELPEKVKLVSTKGLIEDLRNKYSILIVQKKKKKKLGAFDKIRRNLKKYQKNAFKILLNQAIILPPVGLILIHYQMENKMDTL